MVVHLLVGETPGICWMQAVKRKNRLAYLENCSESKPARLLDAAEEDRREKAANRIETWG